MSDSMQIKVPDIGDAQEVDVIEVLVAVGDTVEAEQPLITLESDKATMEIPSPAAGKITELNIKVGDSVSEGSVIGEMKQRSEESSEQSAEQSSNRPNEAQNENTNSNKSSSEKNQQSNDKIVDIIVPDIGEADKVDVIDVLVSQGDQVNKEDSLVTLESDKATMDIPAEQSGEIIELNIKSGEQVSQGDIIGKIAISADSDQSITASSPSEDHKDDSQQSADASSKSPSSNESSEAQTAPQQSQAKDNDDSIPHASPGVRRYARELGADLNLIQGSGSKGRILKEDVKAWIKTQLSSGATSSATQAGINANAGGMGIPPIAQVDFSQFGEIEEVKLSRIKKISGPFLQAAWLNLPHVTHHDEADVTELEAFRQEIKKEAEKEGVRVTMLAFAIKVLVSALKKFPNFNASLSADGEHLILKHYYNIGIAVDTPGGLVVPVIKDADKKSIFELAGEMGDISERARDGKLKGDEMKGGCMSISSLGGIGGTAFTPIVNAPEVAILGLTRARMQPVWNGKEFEPRLMQPIDLSYDHRVIDGAEAARFVRYLCAGFADMRRLSL